MEFRANVFREENKSTVELWHVWQKWSYDAYLARGIATVVNDVVIVDTSVKVGEAVDPADLGDVVPLLLVGQRLEVIKVPTEIMKLLILEKLYLITLLYRTIIFRILLQ